MTEDERNAATMLHIIGCQAWLRKHPRINNSKMLKTAFYLYCRAEWAVWDVRHKLMDWRYGR